MLGIFDRNFVETAARAFGLGISHQQKTVRHYRRSTSPGTEAVLFFFCLASLELARQDAYSHSFRSGAWVWGRRLWFVRRKGGLDLGVGEQQAHDDELWSIMRWQHISLAPNLER